MLPAVSSKISVGWRFHRRVGTTEAVMSVYPGATQCPWPWPCKPQSGDPALTWVSGRGAIR